MYDLITDPSHTDYSQMQTWKEEVIMASEHSRIWTQWKNALRILSLFVVKCPNVLPDKDFVTYYQNAIDLYQDIMHGDGYNYRNDLPDIPEDDREKD